MPEISRRELFTLLAGLGLIAPARLSAAESPARLDLGPAEPFSFERLIDMARERAGQPYKAPEAPSAAILDRIDYDAHGKIKFRTDHALWAPGQGDARPDGPIYPVTFFHLGRYFHKPQRIHVLEGGQAREIRYRRSYFNIPSGSPALELPEDIGFAGFRIQESCRGSLGWKKQTLDWRSNDWVAFLGASYFRAIGDQWQYGSSARGVYVDPAVPGRQEEFPDFTNVWLEQPGTASAEEADHNVIVYALLDGPSIAGAYRFVIERRDGVTMDIEKHLFMREDVERLGIAPLTSMYWYSETLKQTGIDWRPEIHDSDGLAIWTGSGERIWRALNNPPYVIMSSFSDANPRGFGLIQRDRAFGHYGDGVNYHRRPSIWVEPKADWGRGAVQLLEIPTDDEIHDNIVAAWAPEQPAKKGASFSFSYRLFWRSFDPPAATAHVIATRLGRGGQQGRPRPKGVRKFSIEFLGGPLTKLQYGVRPEVVASASRGQISGEAIEPVPSDIVGHWRATFDLTVEGKEPVEIRCYLRRGADALSETWSYQYHPF